MNNREPIVKDHKWDGVENELRYEHEIKINGHHITERGGQVYINGQVSKYTYFETIRKIAELNSESSPERGPTE